jgi:hypothetical protein
VCVCVCVRVCVCVCVCARAHAQTSVSIHTGIYLCKTSIYNEFVCILHMCLIYIRTLTTRPFFLKACRMAVTIFPMSCAVSSWQMVDVWWDVR